jgi:LysM repeat protein
MLSVARLWRGFALVAVGVFLAGCLPSPQSQLEEEKEPHFLAGKSRERSMDYKGAIECFQKALEVNPQSASAHFELGWLYDQKEADYAAAIYHYDRYLRFRTNADNAEMVQTRILACKQELARMVSLGPVTQTMQKELDRLTRDNAALKDELERLRLTLQAAGRPATTGSAAVVARVTNYNAYPVAGLTNQDSLSRTSAVRSAAYTRTHIVKANETAVKIARMYGVRLEALLAANPKLNPNRMKVGQVIVVPPQ